MKASADAGHAYRAANLVNGNVDSYWATRGSSEASVTATFRQPVQINLIRMREAIRLGQRVRRWVLEARANDTWTKLAEEESIGNCRIVRLAQPVTVTQIRLRLVESAAPPALSELGVYLDPA